jgi:hypothetical protein
MVALCAGKVGQIMSLRVLKVEWLPSRRDVMSSNSCGLVAFSVLASKPGPNHARPAIHRSILGENKDTSGALSVELVLGGW